MNKTIYFKNNKCIDCGKLITDNAQRCRNCQGKRNKLYKDGRYNKEYYCIICGNKIRYETWWFGSKKCFSCSHKGNMGKNNGLYIDVGVLKLIIV